MENAPLADVIISSFDGLTAQMQKAARFVLDHPREVALLSMREQARRAGVQPATMTRLAKHFGLSGYDALRGAYADVLRGKAEGFARKAGVQTLRQELEGDRALASSALVSVGRQVEVLAAAGSLDGVVASAQLLADARRIYCLGRRASFPVAWQLHYILSLAGLSSTLLDAPGDIGRDAVRHAGQEDILVIVSVLPYTRTTIDIAAFAHARDVPIVAITDSAVSPLAQYAEIVIVVSTASPTFFHAMAPAFAVAEVLGVLVAGHGGTATLDALKELDYCLDRLGTHALPQTRGEPV